MNLQPGEVADVVRSRSGVGALLLTGLVLVPGAVMAQDARLDKSNAAATIHLSAHLAGPVSGEHPEAGAWQELLARSAAGTITAGEAVCHRVATGSTLRDRAGRRIALRVGCVEKGASSLDTAERPGPTGEGPAVLTVRVEAF